ncbi:histone H1-like [Ananas comosus]|uniref:Histone H1-like n=1 Tax=Ananas comosus TaxID=4615 RepID=A0A6P5EFZ0_ANACO|nr:histone H1-like [Ananas comosus]
MSTTEEAATAAEPVSGDSAAAAAAAEAAPAEPNAAEEKPMKEKKPRTKKPRPKPKPKKSSTPSHPPYFQMIKDAILALDDKTGSSTYAIAKHIEERHRGVLPPNYKKVLAVQLKNFTAKGKLVKVRASFKLAEAEKGEENAEQMTKKPRRAAAAAAGGGGGGGGSKRKAAALATGGAEKRASLRPSRAAKKTKKKAAVLKPKPKPKQPKSIKSRGGSAVAKKAKKVASA